MLDDQFYLQFENRFRGSRAEIAQRFNSYLPLLQSIEKNSRTTALRAIDYGCGRGEWLDLLDSRGWSVVGVDSDAAISAEATRHGRTVIQADAVEHLRQQPDGSLRLVSAFHVVEHLDHNMLVALICESRRALAPGGILILETPNVENIFVGTSNFYLDAMHKKPIHPLFLQFVVDYSGFNYSVILGLNGPPSRSEVSLETAYLNFVNTPPDFALLAQVGEQDCEPPYATLKRVVEESYQDYNAFIAPRVAALATQMRAVDVFRARQESLERELATLREQSRAPQDVALDRLEKRMAACEGLARRLDVKLTEWQDTSPSNADDLDRQALDFERRLAKSERRIKRLTWHAAVFMPISGPLVLVARFFARQVSKFTKKHKENKRSGASVNHGI